jgi:hypothetical protein
VSAQTGSIGRNPGYEGPRSSSSIGQTPVSAQTGSIGRNPGYEGPRSSSSIGQTPVVSALLTLLLILLLGTSVRAQNIKG